MLPLINPKRSRISYRAEHSDLGKVSQLTRRPADQNRLVSRRQGIERGF
jgi:hypothetical protein